MKISFDRITSSGNYIPEIDGLRFISLVSIVFFHLNGFLESKDINQSAGSSNCLTLFEHIVSHGRIGVPLFFVISGLTLGLPFAKRYLAGGNSVSLKKYFLRRLTRLEPPYLLVMTTLFIGAVFIYRNISLKEGLESYLPSVIYSHSFFYPTMLSKLNGVTWTLEIEVQFYILAPLLAYIFSIKSTSIRRLSMIFLTVLFIAFNRFNVNPFITRSLVDYFEFFLVGFLLADLYASNSTLITKTRYDYLIGLFFFLIIWLFESIDFDSDAQKFIWELIQLTSIFFLYYYIIFHKVFKVLTFKLITNIGGMCYSVYLLHYPILQTVGNPLVKHSFSNYFYLNVSIYSFILLSIIMLLSSIFFLLVEKPCMEVKL
jgi:peptidoglycan/LPS O-acetylase OafA/YrhL